MRSCPWVVVAVVVLGAALAACETAEEGCGDAALAVDSWGPACGFPGFAVTLQLTGGCFDADTAVSLVAADGAATALAATVVDEAHVSAVVPAGTARGVYRLRVTRGDREVTKDAAYHAEADIVVSGGYEARYAVVDLCDTERPREVFRAAPWPEGSEEVRQPTVNHDATRVYVSHTDGPDLSSIYGVDLARGTAPVKIAGDDPPLNVFPEASPVGPRIAFMGCPEVEDVCDIYVVNEDGTGKEPIARRTDALPIKITGDVTWSWHDYSPVFSPDGTRVAYLRETVCDSTSNGEAPCENDFYSAVVVRRLEEDCHGVVYAETNARFYDHLYWTTRNQLVWQGRDADGAPQKIYVATYAGEDDDDEKTMEATILEAPTQDGWGDFWWMVLPPGGDALILQPLDTWDMVFYPLAGGGADTQAGAGTLLRVPDPETPGGFVSRHPELDWFTFVE